MKTWRTWVAILIAGAAGIFGAAMSVQSIGWTVNEIAGLAIAIPAFCLWALARLQLGASFAVRAHARALVTHGLYSRIQNPIYVFGALLIVGGVVFSGRPIFFLIFVILIPAQLSRIRKERAVLEATFGDEYRRYRQSTWF